MRSRIGSSKQALQLDFKDPSGMLQASVGCKTKGCPQSDISRGHYHGALPPRPAQTGERSTVHDDTATSTVIGLVAEVEAKSVLELCSLAVRDASGQRWILGPTDFTPSHLKQHMLLGEPVSVTLHDDSGLVSDEIAD